jgi:beta-phosphoglucomutase-like phosphatase (HAD superfamily)
MKIHPRVYVDFDDILSETALGFTEMLEQVFGKRVEFESIFTFDLGHAFGLSPEDTAELMQRMHEPDVLMALRPVPGARDGLRAWREAGVEVHIVTGRPPATRAVSEQWLLAHDMPCTTLMFVDKYARAYPSGAWEAAITLDQLRSLQFCLAVEDSPVMIQFFAKSTTVPLVILDRPWNRREPEGGRATRCLNWGDIMRRFPRPCG